jgi:hypothetical protein
MDLVVSVSNPLHVFEQNVLTAAIVELRCPAVGVTSNSLSGFKGPVIFQKIRDASSPERMGGIIAHNAGISQSPSLRPLIGSLPKFNRLGSIVTAGFALPRSV